MQHTRKTQMLEIKLLAMPLASGGSVHISGKMVWGLKKNSMKPFGTYK